MSTFTLWQQNAAYCWRWCVKRLYFNTFRSIKLHNKECWQVIQKADYTNIINWKHIYFKVSVFLQVIIFAKLCAKNCTNSETVLPSLVKQQNEKVLWSNCAHINSCCFEWNLSVSLFSFACFYWCSACVVCMCVCNTSVFFHSKWVFSRCVLKQSSTEEEKKIQIN